MPAVQSVTVVPDGVTIVTRRGTVTLVRTDFSGAILSGPIATIESTATTLIQNRLSVVGLSGTPVAIHIDQVTPTLIWHICLGTPPMAQWWAP